MKVIANLLLLTVCLLVVQTCYADMNILALHEGNLDPLTEGWVKERAFAGITTFPLDNDRNWQAWGVRDQSGRSDGVYSLDLRAEDVQRAFQDGWTFRTRVRAAQNGESVFLSPVFSRANGPQAFGFSITKTSDSVTLNLSSGASVPLTENYSLLELVYNPASDDADLFVDGVRLLEGFKGVIPIDPQYRDRNSIWFGSGSSEGRGQANFNLVEFAVHSKEPSALDLGDNVLSNPGFETAEPTDGVAFSFNDWGGDASRIVSERSGVKPLETQMLQFIGGAAGKPVDRISDVMKYIDISRYRDQLRSNELRAALTADFNRIGGGTNIGSVFGVTLVAHNGTPRSSPTEVTSLKRASTAIRSDDDVSTWETATVVLRIPFNSEFLQATLSVAENMEDGSEFAGHFADNASLEIYLRGDLNNDGHWGVEDIDQLAAALRNGTVTERMNINENGGVTLSDRRFLIEQFVGSFFGDNTLDGKFNSTDLIAVFEAGEYEDSIVGNSTWAEGDYSGDGEFDSRDLVMALQTGKYESGLGSPVQVPESRFGAMLAAFWICFWCVASRRK